MKKIHSLTGRFFHFLSSDLFIFLSSGVVASDKLTLELIWSGNSKMKQIMSAKFSESESAKEMKKPPAAM